MRPFDVRSIVGSMAVVVAIAGCAGGAAAPSAPSPIAGGSGPAGTGGSANATATCNQLTKADVQPLLADPIATVAVTAAGTDGDGQQCVFGTANSGGAIDVVVLGGSDAAPAYAADVQGLGKAVDVAGIGDRAARDKDDGSDSITSMKGDLYCAVSMGGADGIPGVAAMEQAAGYTSDIGDPAYAAIANALGTLCNRIYGSGNTTPDLSSLTAASASPSAPWA